MKKLFENKIVLVTGSGSGVGKAACLLFAEEGATVVAANRDIDKGSRTVKEIENKGGKAFFIKTDILNENDVIKLMDKITDKFGNLDSAFNCAGYDGKKVSLTDFDNEEWDKIIDTNLRGTFLLLKYEIKKMLIQKKGTIVNMASISGFLGRPGRSAYNASRSAIISLTKTSAVEYINKGIRINAIAPGAIDTGIFKRMTGGDPKKIKEYELAHPIGRIARPQEIAEAALWLCSERSSFVVGHTLVADGGLTLI